MCFLCVVLPLTAQNPLAGFLCQHFPLEIFSLSFAPSVSAFEIQTGEKFTTLLFQVANHSAIALKILFILPYDLEKVSGRFKLLAEDNER